MTPRPAVRRYSPAVCVLVLALFSLPARAADPVLMFMIGFAKNMIESHLEANARKPAPVQPYPLAPVAPIALKAPMAMNSDDRRALVEDSFTYLSREQRTELLIGLEKALADPGLALQREAILGEFVMVARQVGFTHRQLDRLSGEQKRVLADQFAANFRGLPADVQQSLMQQLQLRTLPLPSDLNDMMLTALSTNR